MVRRGVRTFALGPTDPFNQGRLSPISQIVRFYSSSEALDRNRSWKPFKTECVLLFELRITLSNLHEPTFKTKISETDITESLFCAIVSLALCNIACSYVVLCNFWIFLLPFSASFAQNNAD